MDHAEALQSHATERYLLGEMTPQQRETYEEHYFSCQECAADVKATTILIDNAREFVRKLPVGEAVPSSGGFLSWMQPAYAMAAVAVLVVVIGYQNLVSIPRLKQGTAESVQSLTSFSLVTAGSRGGNDLVFNIRPSQPFGLYVDIPGNQNYGSYVAEVQTESGSAKFTVPVSAEQAKETVQLLIPASTLASGRYNLVILGISAADRNGAGQEIVRYPFTLQYNQ
jgi:hypothetical protein